MWWMYHAAARVGLINTLSKIIIIYNGVKFYLSKYHRGMTGRFVSMTNFVHPFVAALVNNADSESNPRRVETFQNEVRKPRHRTAATGAHIWVAINGFSFVACQPIKVLVASLSDRPSRVLSQFSYSPFKNIPSPPKSGEQQMIIYPSFLKKENWHTTR